MTRSVLKEREIKMKETICVCETCKEAYVWNPDLSTACPDCDRPMIKTRFSKEKWATLSEEEKEDVKTDPYAYLSREDMEQERKAMLKSIECIRHDLHTMYTFFMTYCVIVTIAVIIALVTLLLD